ncbi:MAG: hypothetical protein IJO52_11335, partial [Clostridia bacterium]|nr:hypothetical protein [Clostridia bacterium]
ATWGDPKGTSAYNISYNYLNITDQEIGVSHRADDRGYPACTATAYNYFIYEGFYLTYYDRAKLKQMLMDSYYGGVPMNFKCSDSAVYYEIKNDLLSNYGLYYLCQEAFGFKPECKFYSEDEMYMIRIVWE